MDNTDYEYIIIILALVIYGTTAFLLSSMIKAHTIDFDADVSIDMEKVRAMESAHFVSNCLSKLEGGKSYRIKAETIDKYAGKSANAMCNIDDPLLAVKLEDMETGKEWVFGIRPSSSGYTLWVPIMYTDPSGNHKINMGKLNVETA